MALEFDQYNPDTIFRMKWDPEFSQEEINADVERAAATLDQQRANRADVLRWVSSTFTPYDLPRTNLYNLFFETDKAHVQSGHILISEMAATMPFFGAVVKLDTVHNIWEWHDDGEVHSGALCRNGYRYMLLKNYRNPFQSFSERSAWDPFIADMAAKNGKERIDDESLAQRTGLHNKTLRVYERFHQEFPVFDDFLPENIPDDIDEYEAGKFADFNRMVIEAGSFFDYLDIASDPKNPNRFLTPRQAREMKEMFYFIQKKDPDNPIGAWYRFAGPYERFEKIVYETYDFYGYLDEMADGEEPMLDEPTNYKIKIMSFWYNFPTSLEALTAKWVDKYTGLMAALQGPFDLKAHGYTELPETLADHVFESFGSLLKYYWEIRTKLSRYPQAQHELDYKTAALFNTYSEAGYTNLVKGLPISFPQLVIPDARIENYNFYEPDYEVIQRGFRRQQAKIVQLKFDYTSSRLMKRRAA